MSRWFRHYAGLCSDSKFGGIARRAKTTRERAVFVFLCILEQASEKNDGGEYGWDADAVADILNCDTDDVEKIHAEMVGAGIVDGKSVSKWKERQFESDVSTERVARFRNKKKDKSNVPDKNGNVSETFHGVPETPPENIDRDTSSLRSDAPQPARDQDADLFKRGREVLGKNCGGQLAKLKSIYEGSIAKTRAALEVASTKDQPAEYLAKVIANGGKPMPRAGPVKPPDEIRDPMVAAADRYLQQFHG